MSSKMKVPSEICRSCSLQNPCYLHLANKHSNVNESVFQKITLQILYYFTYEGAWSLKTYFKNAYTPKNTCSQRYNRTTNTWIFFTVNPGVQLPCSYICPLSIYPSTQILCARHSTRTRTEHGFGVRSKFILRFQPFQVGELEGTQPLWIFVFSFTARRNN